MVTSEIVKVQPSMLTYDEVERAARAMSASGFFADSKQAAQAVVKILAGQELGFGPFASMTGVHIIQNKPTLAANLMAAAVKRTGKYNYRVVEHTAAVCELAFFEDGKEVGRSRFTMEDAKQAGLTTNQSWQKYPRNMLFSRALSNGQKWFAPDVFNGATVYTPEELGADVNEDGAVISAPPGSVIDMTPEPAPKVAKSAKPDRPISSESLRSFMASKIKKYTDAKVTVSDAERHVVAAVLDTTFNGEKTKRYELCHWLVGESSTKKMPPAQVKALMDWLECHKYEDVPPQYVISEANSAHAVALQEAGQLTLEAK